MLKTLLRYLPSQIIPALVTFVLIGVNSQYLGAEKYGVLVLAVALVEVVCLLSHQWLKVSYIRYFSELKGGEHEDFKSTVDVLFAVSLIVFCMVFVALNFYHDSLYKEVVYLSILLYAAKTIYQYFLDKIRMQEMYWLYNVSSVTFSISSIVMTVILYVCYEVSVESSIMALMISYTLSYIFMLGKAGLKFDSYSRGHAGMCVVYGFPLTMSAVLVQLISKVDRYFIAHFLGAAAVGYYSAVVGLVFGLISLVFTVVAAPLYPEIIKKSRLGKKKLNESLGYYIVLLTLVVIPSVVGFYSVSNELAFMVLGEEFESVVVTLIPSVMVAAVLHNLNNHLLVYGIIISKKTYRSTICSVCSLVSMVLFNYMLVPVFGLIAAPVVSIVSVLLSSVLMVAYSKGYVVFRMQGKIIPILVSSMLMFLSTLLFDFIGGINTVATAMIAKIVVGCFVYVLFILLLSGGIDGFKIKYLEGRYD